MTTVLFFRTNYHFANLMYGFFNGVSSVADTAVEWFFATCLLTNLALQLGLYFGRDALTNHLNQVFRVNKMLGGELLIPQAKRKGLQHPFPGKKYNDGCTVYMRKLAISACVPPLFFLIIFPYKSNQSTVFLLSSACLVERGQRPVLLVGKLPVLLELFMPVLHGVH